jgi:Protein of unknown function (DUF993)
MVDVAPWQTVAVDWDATLAFRRHLWGMGFKIAEAMDTSQRGMGLDWPTARELIRRSLAESRTIAGADLACGVGTDQLAAEANPGLDGVRAAYEEQLEAVEAAGGRAILMASRALARAARSADDYLAVYGGLIRQAKEPVILHWLGDMFDPQLAGYWGSTDLDTATETVLSLINEHRSRIGGIKISLLEQAREVALRRRLPPGVPMFTGDDFNYAELIEGDAQGNSHATAPSSHPPSRSRARSSRHPPSTTRPASCSSPGSTATRSTSPWPAACSPPARPCTTPTCSVWRTGPGCCATPTSPARGWLP